MIYLNIKAHNSDKQYMYNRDSDSSIAGVLPFV